jgi:starvation-inducible DNA-binding protein
MLHELMEDNKHMAAAMRKGSQALRQRGSRHRPSARAFQDETEHRTLFLFEANRQEGANAA